MNQIINMILRQITRKLVNKGVDAGINKASQLGRSQPSDLDQSTGDVPQPAHDGGLSQQEVRRQRQAKKAIRQARQAAKIAQRGARF